MLYHRLIQDRRADSLLSVSANPWDYSLSCSQDISDNSEFGPLKIWCGNSFKRDCLLCVTYVWKNLLAIIFMFSFYLRYRPLSFFYDAVDNVLRWWTAILHLFLIWSCIRQCDIHAHFVLTSEYVTTKHKGTKVFSHVIVTFRML